MEEMKFLQNLEKLLKIHNMKKSELAKVIGITQPTITAWYTKGYDNVSLSILRKICNFYHITLDELIYGDTETITVKVNEFTKEELKVLKTVSEFMKSSRKE